VGSYVNNESQLDHIGWWIEFACGVEFETIKLNRRSDFRCAWTSFLSVDVLSCIFQVSLEYMSHVSWNGRSTWYHLDSQSIPGYIQLYYTGSVSRELGSWQWFSCAIDCKWFNIVDSVSILNSFMTLLSGVPAIDKHQIIGIKLGSSCSPQNLDLMCRLLNQNFRRTIWDDDEQWLQRRDILPKEHTALQNFTWFTIILPQLVVITYWFIPMRLWFSWPHISLRLTSFQIHHNNQLIQNEIEL